MIGKRWRSWYSMRLIVNHVNGSLPNCDDVMMCSDFCCDDLKKNMRSFWRLTHLKCIHMFFVDAEVIEKNTSESNKIRKNPLKTVDGYTHAQDHLIFASQFFFREVIWCACIESKNIFAVFGFNRICTTELYFKRSFIVHDTEFFIISDCGSGLQLFLILFNDINEKRLIRACWAWLMLSSRSIRFYFEISETRLKVNHCSVTGKFRAITSRHWWLLA